MSTRAGYAGDIATQLSELRVRAASDKRVFTEPAAKAVCARRWRYLFLNEAANDPVALEQASKSFWDRRSARQRIAEYFLHGSDQGAWQDEQPDAQALSIRSTTLIACPGLLNGLFPVFRDFREQLPRVEQHFGMRILRSDSHPVRGCEANVADIMRAINEGKGLDAGGREIPAARATPPGDVLLLGYSKGAPDILTTLVQHPDIAPRVRCIFTVAGAIGGSQLADRAVDGYRHSAAQKRSLEAGQELQSLLPRGFRLGRYAGRRLPEFDALSATQDLTTSARGAFLTEHGTKLDALNIPMFYLRGATRRSDVPWSQRGGYQLLSKFDAYNDMQLTRACASLPLPMATDLGLLRGHHWDLAYPSFVKGRYFGYNKTYHPFPKYAMLAAIIGLSAELGLIE